MLKSKALLRYLKFAIPAAVAYCVMASIFISDKTFTKSWVLYIGNALFAIGIACYVLLHNYKRNENETAQHLVLAGHIVTALGIFIACIICLLLLFIITPAVFNNTATAALNQPPPQMLGNKHNEFIIALFASATIGNVCGGSFFSIILAYTAKRNQKENT